MTNMELWELNKTTIIEAFRDKNKDCKADKCPGESKNVFCEHFNRIYHKRWEEILKNG